MSCGKFKPTWLNLKQNQFILMHWIQARTQLLSQPMGLSNWLQPLPMVDFLLCIEEATHDHVQKAYAVCLMWQLVRGLLFDWRCAINFQQGHDSLLAHYCVGMLKNLHGVFVFHCPDHNRLREVNVWNSTSNFIDSLHVFLWWF